MKEFTKIVDHHTFHGYEFGDRSFPSLICLHGMTGDSKSFTELVDYLLDDFHLILLDSPGHGETDPLQKDEDYSFSSLAKRLYNVIETIVDESFYILGHSWGADLALHMAKLVPTKVKGVILLDGGYVFPEWVEAVSEESALLAWKEYLQNSTYQSWNEVIETYQEYTTRKWDENLDSIVYSNFKKEKDRYVLRADECSLFTTIKAFFIEPCSTIYASIQCPVLLFHATIPETDLSRIKGLEDIKQRIEQVEVIGIENTKHNIHWDRPETVAAEIRCWKRDNNREVNLLHKGSCS